MKNLGIICLILISTGFYGCKRSTESRDINSKELNSLNMERNNEISHIEFGFGNEKGDQVLMLKSDTLLNPEEYTIALFNQGVVSNLEYVGYKTATSEDTGRQISTNFINSGGYHFKMNQGNVENDQTVILLTNKFHNNKNVREFSKTENKKLPANLISKIELEKTRNIKHYESLIQINDDKVIYLIEFEPVNDSLLVSLTLVNSGRIVFKDFPAQYDSMSAWRVDDGGEFGFENYNILAVFEKDGKIELVTNWVGAEGNLIEYIVEDGTKFKTLKEAYRYTVPL